MAARKTPSLQTVTLGTMIDALYSARALRIEQQRVVDEMKGKEKELHAKIIEMLDKQDTAKASGRTATASITETVQPVTSDWKKLYTYIKKYDAFELLQRRVATTAWREVHEAGKKIPGIDAIKVRDLSVTKSGGA